ncbi:hypothetical protein KIN20_019187 [Parelaphostrongylus tenuis]|uniref:Uncharacterized protein n=1 Tax=Parelaphostrongylus tenuis TaxID=148309 RepID=A0AAD5ML08_PARTN|nr:hypothetical protein KIN20_019187 [Parelaphostrongylus tenuis]
MNSSPSFQTGEIITFYMLGFTILMTVSVVVYYKYMSHNVSSRPMDTSLWKNKKMRKMTKCTVLMDKFVRRRS